MTLQEIFDKAVAHFAQMEKPSMSTPKQYGEYGGSDCAYRGHEDNKCIVGAFIDDEHYDEGFEGKGVLEYATINRSCGVQPVLRAVARSMGVKTLNDEQGQLLYKLQLIHDDHSGGFDINEDNWYETVQPYLAELAEDNGFNFNVG
tara:strand:+ start:294 stop:731 length:438 start_codon:yes stop_codon:yes gene_type:complete